MSESVNDSPLRNGNITSSTCFKLFGSNSIYNTYIEEKNLERKLGRSLTSEAYSNDMAWGTFLESRVNDLLGTSYYLCSNDTSVHKDYDFWSGTKDFIIYDGNTKVGISELKCYQPKNFAKYSDAIMLHDFTILKKDFAKEYWQAVSNAIIEQVDIAELLCYCPYKSELSAIRQMAVDYDKADSWKYDFIYKKEDSWLAWIPDGGYYKNLNIFRFIVPQTDKDLLTSKIKEAGKLLINIK